MTSPSATAPTPKGTGTLVDNGAARHSRILGVGAYRPARVVTNSEIVDKIDSSDEWIRERSGIISRRFAADDESVIDMAVAASRAALEHAGIAPEQIGFVLVATVTHPLPDPGRRARARVPAGHRRQPAFDISAACAGYCYGVALASDMVRGGIGRLRARGRRREAQRLHRPLRPRAAPSSSATARARPSSAPATPRASARSCGAPTARSATPSRRSRPGPTCASRGSPRRPTRTCGPPSAWPGRPVFRWAVWGMAQVAQQALDAAGISADDLDVFIPHQANMRIIDAMAKQLKLPARRRRRPRHRRRRATPRPPPSRSPLDRMLARRDPKQRRPRAPDRLRRRPGRTPPRCRASLASRTAVRTPDARSPSRTSSPQPRTHRTQARTRKGASNGHHRRDPAPAWPRSSTRRPASTPTTSQLDKSFTDDLDIDSLSMVTIVVDAEEKFGVAHPRRRGQEPQDRRRRRRFIERAPGLTRLTRRGRAVHRTGSTRRQVQSRTLT